MKNREVFLRNPVSLGTWLSSGSAVVAELAVQFGFDWFLYDMEHGNGTDAQLLEALRCMTPKDAKTIVRVAGLNSEAIARALDWGADGIMLPHVSNAGQAAECVAAMRYVPHGHRGYSSSVRAYNFGLEVPLDPSQVKPILMAQIEDLSGVLHAEEIAAIDGVDVLFVGPADLKLALSHQAPDSGGLSFDEALRLVAEAAITAGKTAGILMRDKSDFDYLKSIGYSCIAVDSDLAILKRGYTSIIGELGGK